MKAVYLKVRLMAIAWLSACLVACTSNVEADLEVIEYPIAFQASLMELFLLLTLTAPELVMKPWI